MQCIKTFTLVRVQLYKSSTRHRTLLDIVELNFLSLSRLAEDNYFISDNDDAINCLAVNENCNHVKHYNASSGYEANLKLYRTCCIHLHFTLYAIIYNS